MQKKGQIQPAMVVGVIGVVITLVALGIVLSTSQKSMSTIKTSVAENKVASLSTESISFANNTPTGFVQKSLVDGTLTVTSGNNFNSNITLNKGRNYTVVYTESGSYIVPLNETTYDWYNNSKLYVNYSYYYGSSERNITLQGQEGVKTLQDFQPTWGVIFAAFIVITFVIGLFVIIYNKMG